MRKRVVVGLCLGCVLLGCIIGGTSGFFTREATGVLLPKNVDIFVDAPLKVAVRENFSFDVYIANTASRSQTLESIDFSIPYLRSVGIVSSEPRWIGVQVLEWAEFQVFVYQRSIAPGETLTVRFSVLALSPGDHRGEVDVCINAISRCARYAIRTVVEQEH